MLFELSVVKYYWYFNISNVREQKTFIYYLVNLTNTVIIIISTFWFSEYSNIDNYYHK